MADNISNPIAERPSAESIVHGEPMDVSSSNNEVSSGISSSGTDNNADKDLISSLHEMSLYKTPREFLDDLIIARAPDRARANNPAKSASREEIAKYRKKVLNHPDTKHRFVFREWPRDPKGPVITPENSRHGMMSVSGVEIWGPTVFDLYTVRRIPNVPNLVTYTSGSKLANWMQGEKETHTQDLVNRYKNEEAPDDIEPYDVELLIREAERLKINEELTEKSWNKDDASKRFEVPEAWPPMSPFSPSAYPSPWPIMPFTNRDITRIPTLQKYIPPSLFPAKLVVHDPFHLLAAETPRNYRERDEFNERFQAEQKVKWNEREDMTVTYRLQHSERNKIRRERDAMQYAAIEEHKYYVRKRFLFEPHTRNELPEGFELHQDIESGPGPVRPPIYVVLPFLPNKKQIEEAHLYIAPVCRLGEGNHSFVYRAELEVPRNFLVEPEICNQCVIDDANAILLEQDGENGERRNPKWDQKSGKYVIKTTDICPQITEMKDPVTGKKQKYVVNPGGYKKELVYEGPFRAIESRVQYQDLAKGPYCKHLKDKVSAIHPLTSKVHVAAKLSKQGDRHLAAEAENYQKFPKHFFEHSGGYNILEPIHDPTPLGAVVPQFYGYYVVDPAEQAARDLKALQVNVDAKKAPSHERKRSSSRRNSYSSSHSESESAQSQRPMSTYLSPILLLEDCGEPVVPEKIAIDDKTEAGSMIYRFHYEGWLHGSVAKRNIVMQPGPIHASPSERAKNAKARGGLGKDWSFRLIDFGRSTLEKANIQVLTARQIHEASAVTGWIGGWGNHGI